ncbi:MAG: hypothetical protein U0L43_05295 [Muribaculaceae bacterium]|nr:hypothetical protein [Muribaculaceae bacterium]
MSTFMYSPAHSIPAYKGIVYAGVYAYTYYAGCFYHCSFHCNGFSYDPEGGMSKV